MCGRGTWSQVQCLPLGIPGLPGAGFSRCSQASWGSETMGGSEGPSHGGVSWLLEKKKEEERLYLL